MKYQKEYNRCKTENLPVPQQPNVIGSYILELCNRLATKSNFNGYTFIDIMVGEAIENLCKAVMKYNPDKTDNIFNYFTTVAWRAFQFRIIEEREQNAIKHKYYQHTYRISELEGNNILDLSDNEYSNKVIDEFEKKQLNKATPAKKKGPKKVVKKVVKAAKKGVEKLLKKKNNKLLTTRAVSNTMGHI